VDVQLHPFFDLSTRRRWVEGWTTGPKSQITRWCRVLERLRITQIVKKFPACYRTESIIQCLQDPATDPYPESDESSPQLPYFPKIHSNIILHLPLDVPSELFPSGFPTKASYEFLIAPTHATCLSHLILLDLITRWSGQIMKLFIMQSSLASHHFLPASQTVS